MNIFCSNLASPICGNIIAICNLIVMGFLSYFLYRLTKKQGKIQETLQHQQNDLQKRDLKMQLFDKRYPMYTYIDHIYSNMTKTIGNKLLKYIIIIYMDDSKIQEFNKERGILEVKKKEISLLFDKELSDDILEFLDIYKAMLGIIIYVYNEFHFIENDTPQSSNRKWSLICLSANMDKDNYYDAYQDYPDIQNKFIAWKEEISGLDKCYNDKYLFDRIRKYLDIQDLDK